MNLLVKQHTHRALTATQMQVHTYRPCACASTPSVSNTVVALEYTMVCLAAQKAGS